MRATHFWRQIEGLGTKNVSYFHFLQSDMVFGSKCHFVFVNIQCRQQRETLPDCNAFLLTYINVMAAQFLQATEA